MIKDAHLDIRISSDDLKLINRAAAKVRRTLPDWVRLTLTDEARKILARPAKGGG